MERIEEQKRHFINALNIMEKAELSDSSKYAQLLMDYSEVYIANNELDEAVQLLKRAKKIFENNGEDNRLKVAETCNLMGTAYMQTGEMDKAEEVLSESLATLIGIPDTYIERAAAHVSLAQVLRVQEKNEAAKRHIETAIDIFEEVGVKDMHCAAALSAMAEILFVEKNYPDAVKAFEKAAEIILDNYGVCPPYEIVMKNLQQVKELI